MSAPPFVDGNRIREALSVGAAADALHAALRAGLDPELEPARDHISIGDGQLLMMPAEVGPHATVKLVTIGGTPRIQGICAVFDTRTLSPLALLDGVGLTNLRTPAVSLLAVRRMLAGDPRRLLVFGAGPQASLHADAFRAEFGLTDVMFVHRATPEDEVRRAVSRADLICCATTARAPLFDGALVPDRAVVVAIGSHERSARELDARLVGRATVAVESRQSALREAGDVILAGLAGSALLTLAELAAGRSVADDRPRVFKSTGMSWEDTVVAAAVLDAVGIAGRRDAK